MWVARSGSDQSRRCAGAAAGGAAGPNVRRLRAHGAAGRRRASHRATRPRHLVLTCPHGSEDDNAAPSMPSPATCPFPPAPDAQQTQRQHELDETGRIPTCGMIAPALGALWQIAPLSHACKHPQGRAAGCAGGCVLARHQAAAAQQPTQPHRCGSEAEFGAHLP